MSATDSTVVGGDAPPTDGLLLLHVGPNGTLREQRSINADPHGAAALAIGREGELYVTGTYVDTLWLDEETWLPPALQENRTRVPRRFFLARYESDGRLAWARHTTGEKWSVVFSEGVALSVDESGDVHVGMRFRGEMVVDGDTLSSLSRTSLQVAAYSAQGARQYGLVLSAASDGGFASLATYADRYLFVAYAGTLHRYRLGKVASGEEPDPKRPTVRIEDFPDPVSDLLQFEVTLPANAHARLTVYDVLGRQKLCALDRSMASGLHRLTVPVSHLAPGRYLYRLEAGAETASGSFAVVR